MLSPKKRASIVVILAAAALSVAVTLSEEKKMKPSTLIATLCMTIVSACGEDAPEGAEVRDACDAVALAADELFSSCGYELEAKLRCAAASDADVDALEDCAAEIAAATCASIEASSGTPSCDALENAGKLKAAQ